jgi:hypothetical protein
VGKSSGAPTLKRRSVEQSGKGGPWDAKAATELENREPAASMGGAPFASEGVGSRATDAQNAGGLLDGERL